MKATGIVFALAAVSMSVCAQETPPQPTFGILQPGITSSFEMQESEVLAVFAADHEGGRFRAYQVKWQGHDVVVSDPLASTDYKKGDKIKVMANSVELPTPGGKKKILQFMLIDIPQLPPLPSTKP